jgi:hypothetical protein
MQLHKQQKSLQNQNNHNTLLDNFIAQYGDTSLYCMAMAVTQIRTSLQQTLRIKENSIGTLMIQKKISVNKI